MASAAKIQPPFAWLGRRTALASVIGAAGLAAFFRFYHLASLPPGIHSRSASVGLQALDLLEHGWLPGLNAINSYAPLWVWLQAISIKLLGHTELALRLWPAILGTLAVVTTWLWVRSWFGLRTAWLASLLLAVTPWAVTLSRSDSEAVLYPLLASLTLWLATRAWRQPNLQNALLLAGSLVAGLLSGPVGWLIVITVIGIAIALLAAKKRLLSFDRNRLIGAAGFGLGLAGLGYLLAISANAVKDLPQASGFVGHIGTLGSNLVKTLLMFNITGDQNYSHNLSGEPLLNAFVGLMLVAGLLVGVSRLHERRYRLLFVLVFALLLPSILTTTGAPNAARAGAALPAVMVLAATGISYMLELWYRTFPINSAARAAGQGAIIVLLGLTIFQGYTQYFRAWAGSSQVYAAHNEGAVKMAHHLRDDKFTGQRYVVATPDEQPIVAYLDHRDLNYTPLEAKDIAALPITPGARQFLISASARADAVANLKLKFPGGILRPLYSDFNFTEICYVYEVTK